MSDPQPAPGKKTPPRAEPLQPDRPGRGDDIEPGGEPHDDAAERQKSRSEDALENVREGYR